MTALMPSPACQMCERIIIDTAEVKNGKHYHQECAKGIKQEPSDFQPRPFEKSWQKSGRHG